MLFDTDESDSSQDDDEDGSGCMLTQLCRAGSRLPALT